MWQPRFRYGIRSLWMRPKPLPLRGWHQDRNRPGWETRDCPVCRSSGRHRFSCNATGFDRVVERLVPPALTIR